MQKFTFFFSSKESVTSPGEFNLRITSSPSYEFLKEDLKSIFDMLSVSADIKAHILGHIPNFKMTRRKFSFIKTIDYYDDNSISVVNERFSNWFTLGGYRMAHSLEDLKDL